MLAMKVIGVMDKGLLGAEGDANGNPSDDGGEESVKGGSIPSDACPDPNNCTPPAPSAGEVRDHAQ